jgi:hypothetical protein
MRFRFTLFGLLIACQVLFSQEGKVLSGTDQQPRDGFIKQQLDQMMLTHGIKQSIQPFEVVEDLSGLSGFRNTVEEASFVRLKQREIGQLIQFKPKTLTLPITLGDGTVLELELYEKSVFSDDAVIRTQDGDLFAPQANVHYRGVVKGHPGSLAGLSFFPDEVIGVVSTPTHGSVVIGLLEGQRDIHVIYKTDHLDAPQDFTCGVDSESHEPHDLPHEDLLGGARALDECIRVYIEADFALFQNKGGTQQVINYVTGIFNNVLIIYNNEQINAEISEIFVWTTMDNYSRSSSSTALNQFRTARQNFNGNLAHLFALGGNGLGGIAYVNVLCSKPSAFAYSNISSSFQNYPTYSWTIMVVTHEMGHNVGSNHTHWCGWAGGAIDNCYQTEGGCPQGPAPNGGGTVMSYCHLTNFGINLTKGFGPLPGNLIRSRVQNAQCLFECSGLCDNLTADFTITHTSCKENNGIIEVDPSGGQSPYTVNIGFGFVQQTIFTDLEPGIYTVIVRDNNDCEAEFQIEIEPSVRPEFTISAVNTSCGEENGIIEITVFEGNPPYEYNIGFGPTNQNAFFDLAGGTYNILVSDGAGCTNTAVVVIDPSDPLLADLEIRHTTCGNRNGRVTINAFGGTPPYRYTFNGIYRQSPVFDSLQAGNYSFEIVDFYNCVFTVPVTINPSTGIVATASTIPASCGGANGSVTVTVTQGFSPYTYSLNGQSQPGNTFHDLAPGAYTVVVTDSTGCTRAVQATVGTSGTLNLSADIEHAWCGENKGAITIIPLNGEAPFSFDFGNGMQPENRIENLAAGMYSVMVVDSTGCEGNISVEILTSPSVLASAVSTPSSCTVNDGTILISASGGTPPFVYAVGSMESPDPLFEQLAAGMYWVSATDSLGCADGLWVTVASASGLTAAVTTSAANCGEDDGEAVVEASGGTSPYTYDIGLGPQNDGIFPNLPAGQYQVLVTDAANCSFLTVFTIEGFGPILVEVAEEDTRCGLDNGRVEATVSGGNGMYTYFINTVEVPGPVFENLPAGQHVLKVTDSAGCETSVSFTIESSSAMTVNTVVTFSSCENPNGSIEVNVSGGYPPYVFNIGQGPQAQNRFLGLNAGNYRLVITDSLGCEQVRDLVVGNDGFKPVASYRSILNGHEVIFVNTSRGNPETSQWDFGDGNTSNAFNPRHTYDELKSYRVCLTVTNTCGESTLCQDIDVNGARDCIANDSLALVALYESTKGEEWTEKWDLSTPINTWYGLTFDPSGCLTRIHLEDNQLDGELPVEIGNFLTLQYLNLSKNKLVGIIPESFGNLVTLEDCLLAQNELEGNLPSSVAEMQSLGHLNVSHNRLSGELPTAVYDAANLQFLHLGHNAFRGTMNSDLGKLGKLIYLDLSDNQLEGSFPDVWPAMKRLQYVYVDNNQLSGELPAAIISADSLKALWLSGNAFTGIPDFTSQTRWQDDAASGIRWENNRLTFTHLMPNKPVLDVLINRTYAPQAKVYKDTLIQLVTGQELTLDIEVDKGVPGVEYLWFRNGVFLYSSSEPVLTITQAQLSDAGLYHCELRHSDLPQLTLVSHNIVLDVTTSTYATQSGIGLRLAPNPVYGGTSVRLIWEGEAAAQNLWQVTFSDLRGNVVRRDQIMPGAVSEITVPAIPGLYYLTLRSEALGVVVNRKIVVY